MKSSVSRTHQNIQTTMASFNIEDYLNSLILEGLIYYNKTAYKQKNKINNNLLICSCKMVQVPKPQLFDKT